MKMYPVEHWAKTIGVTSEEFNDYLAKLNYQVLSDENEIWYITKQGSRYGRVSRNPFRKVNVWSIDALFSVLKIGGKITGEFFYCDKCDSYLSHQSGFETTMGRWVCKRCGHVNKLFYDPEDYIPENE